MTSAVYDLDESVGAPDDWSSGASGWRGHIIDALVKEDAPIVCHEPRPDFLSLQHSAPEVRDCNKQSDGLTIKA